MRLHLPSVLAVLLGSLSLAVPLAQAASFGTGEDRRTIDEIAFGLPGSSCPGAATTYAANVRQFLPQVETAAGTVTYTLQGVPAGLTFDSGTRLLQGTLATDLRQASEVSHSLTYTATDTAGSDSLTFDIEIADQRPTLETLYTSTKGANWTTKTNWAADIPAATCLTSLHGVTLNQRWSVRILDLSSNNLTGSIPEEIEDLHALHTLDLSDNGLTGSIPEDLEHVHDLYVLDLSHNGLTGSIPEDVGHLHQLRTLDLSHNSLTGSIPEDFDSSAGFTHPGHLERIDLSHNKLTGSIPTFARGAPRLTDLNLSHNQLTGGIPSDVSSLGDLNNLNLSNNKLTGAIPAAFNKTLVTLDLSHNEFAGAIPAELHSTFYTSGQGVRVRTQLIILDLSHNKLTGAIPTLNAFLNGFGSLQTLDLSHNKLTGSITAPGFGLGFLVTLDLSHNQLTGSVPSFNQTFNIQTLDLSHNQLSGTIPATITADPEFGGALINLYLHNNNLSGEIPGVLAKDLSPLRRLSLYHNPPPDSTSTASLYKFPSDMNKRSELNLLVPNTGYTMCLYDDAMGADGSTACAIPTRVDQLRLIRVDESRPWDCTAWIAVEWKPMFTSDPSGYELQYRPTGATNWTSVQVNGTEPFVAINGLTPGGSYEVRVRTSDTPGHALLERDLRTPWLLTSISLSSDGATD